MFTVKVYERLDDGSITDTLFEASQVRKSGDDIVCDVAEGQITYTVSKERHEDDVDQKLYVMNRYGATVATYTL